MVRGIPGFVRLSAFAPVYSPKLPLATVGTSPEIKLPEAAVQVGVSGTVPIWLVPVTVICDEAELTRKNRARDVSVAGLFFICMGGFIWSFSVSNTGFDGNNYDDRIKVTRYKVEEMAYLMDNLAGPKCRCFNSWSFVQTFPLHHPAAIIRKTGRVFAGGRAIPSRRHHRHGIKQPAVAGQIRPGAAGANTTFVVMILHRGIQQRFNCQFRIAQPGRSHGHPRKIPAPRRVPIPFPAHLLYSAPGHGGVEPLERRQHSGNADNVEVVRIARGVSVRTVVTINIKAVLCRQWRETAHHIVPMRFAFKAEAQAPLLSPLERNAPVAKLKYGVASKGAVIAFVGGPDGIKVVMTSDLVPGGVVSHEIRGAEDNVLPFIESSLCGMQPVVEFGEKNRVRLFPEQRHLGRPAVVIAVWPC